MERITAIATVAVALSPGNLSRLRTLLPKVVPEPVPADVAYELLLQSHLFFGFAQAIEAAKVFSEVVRCEGQESRFSPAEKADSSELRLRGRALCEQIYQPNFERLMANLSHASPELAEWMMIDGYGKVLSRPGPAALEREIASIVFLAISGHPVQLHSHVRGARNLGAKAEFIMQAIISSGLSGEQIDAVRAKVEQVYRQ